MIDKAGFVEVTTASIERENTISYFLLLPTADTHGHHRAATVLALEAISHIPEDKRPVALGAEPGRKGHRLRHFHELAGAPITRTVQDRPAFVFDRSRSFGYHNALNYTIVVNWIVAATQNRTRAAAQPGRAVQTFESIKLITAPCPNRTALELLRDGKVYVAGSHLRDDRTGEYNLPHDQDSLSSGGGCGEPAITRQQLSAAGIGKQRVIGYDQIANGHLATALGVSTGRLLRCH